MEAVPATSAGPRPRASPTTTRTFSSCSARGDTTGVFQFESGGMRRLLMEMKPDRLEDLIAANALFRPGPMDLIPDYNDRKHGRSSRAEGPPHRRQVHRRPTA
jgi:DNA polymerase III alpha subunit